MHSGEAILDISSHSGSCPTEPANSASHFLAPWFRGTRPLVRIALPCLRAPAMASAVFCLRSKHILGLIHSLPMNLHVVLPSATFVSQETVRGPHGCVLSSIRIDHLVLQHGPLHQTMNNPATWAPSHSHKSRAAWQHPAPTPCERTQGSCGLMHPDDAPDSTADSQWHASTGPN